MCADTVEQFPSDGGQRMARESDFDIGAGAPAQIVLGSWRSAMLKEQMDESGLRRCATQRVHRRYRENPDTDRSARGARSPRTKENRSGGHSASRDPASQACQ
jgi:hypothetical protein